MKKYTSLKDDLKGLISFILDEPKRGISICNHCFKIIMRIKSKNSGKSAGARIIYYVYYEGEKIFLLSIYDKSEITDISEKEIKSILEQLET